MGVAIDWSIQIAHLPVDTVTRHKRTGRFKASKTLQWITQFRDYIRV